MLNKNNTYRNILSANKCYDIIEHKNVFIDVSFQITFTWKSNFMKLSGKFNIWKNASSKLYGNLEKLQHK